MLSGVTESGFEFEIDEEALDDMEYLEALAEAEDDSTRFPRVIEMTLGKEGKKRLYDHVRNEKGRASATKAIAEFTEILEKAGNQTKN